VKLTDLRSILQYIPSFREKIFVISVDGAIVTSENFANILLDIAVLRSLNIRVVLVHGAAEQIALLGQEVKIQPSNLDGSGVTDAATLKLALTAANRLTHEILEGLSANDLRAATCNALIAHPLGIIHGQDHLFTGKIERIDVEMLQGLLAQGIIPVVPPLGFDGDGKTYRVNSDAVALEVAKALNATKLIFIATLDGLVYQDKLIQQLLGADLVALLAQHKGSFAPEILSKAQYASAACAAGVSRVHIINGRVDEALLAEVFSNEGIGTLVYANEYQQIRRAMKKDIRAILALTKNSVESEELIKRTRATLEKNAGRLLYFRNGQEPRGLRRLASIGPDQGGIGLPLCQPFARKSGHRPKTRRLRRIQGARTRPQRVDYPLHPGVHLFSVKGWIRRRHSRRPAAGAPRKIRPERKKLQGVDQEIAAEMKLKAELPPEAVRACARNGVAPTRYFLAINIARQTTTLFSRPMVHSKASRHKLVKHLRCSTSRYGIGEVANSNMTPRGLHRVAKKVGGGWPTGTAFESRKVVGFTWDGKPQAEITTRILWLEGLEPGLNRGENIDSYQRYIYIHGTGNETKLGRPASAGCVHLAAQDLMPLYDLLPEGTLVWISER